MMASQSKNLKRNGVSGPTPTMAKIGLRIQTVLDPAKEKITMIIQNWNSEVIPHFCFKRCFILSLRSFWSHDVEQVDRLSTASHLDGTKADKIEGVLHSAGSFLVDQKMNSVLSGHLLNS